MANRIQILLDYPFTALYGEGWGMSKLAGGLQFAERVTVDGVSKLVPSGAPRGVWKVPGLGIITLIPRFINLGTLELDDPLSDAYKLTEVDIAPNDTGEPALRILAKSGSLARTRTTAASAVVSTFTNFAVQQKLSQISAYDMRVIWRTKNALLANEGWSYQFQPIGTYDDPRTNAYSTAVFGGKFLLAIDLQGTATLYENLGSVTEPNWVSRKSFDVGGAGIDFRKEYIVTCIPLSGRYILFRFGNVRFRQRAHRPSRYVEQRDFVFDVIEEGSGNYYDVGLDQYVCIPPGKLEVAVNASGVDYRFVAYKVRYAPEPVTVRFTGEPLANPLPGQTPELTVYGYAKNTGDVDPTERTGAGDMNITFVNETGGAWDDASMVICPEVTLSPSANGVWSPEIYWIEGRVDPRVYQPPYEPVDVSPDWVYFRFQETASMESGQCSIKLKEGARFDKILRRGGPVRILFDGQPIFDGYFPCRKPTVGHNEVETELEGRDMWARLSVPVGKFESLDGKKVGDVIYRLLRRAGFLPEEIDVQNDNLNGMTVGEFSEAQNLKIYNASTTVEEAIKDLAEKYTVQDVERIRVRWISGAWRVYLTPYGTTGPDPEIVLTTTQEAEPPGDDATRWALKCLRITSYLEWDIQWPEYNALRVIIGTASGDTSSALEAVMLPRPEVLDDPNSQMFEGCLRFKEISAPEATATTKGELATLARFKYDDDARKVVGLGVQAEWQPFFRSDQECAVVGKHPITGQVISYGVFRATALDIEGSQDETVSTATGVYLRSWEWTSAYRLIWLRETSPEFAPYGVVIPMYDGILPPPGYLTMGVLAEEEEA